MNEPKLIAIDESGSAGEPLEEVVAKEAPAPEGQKEMTTEEAMRAGLAVPQQLHRRALAEFKQWKKQIIDIIKRESTIAWALPSPHNFVYQFVLPPRLVKLVWTTTIKERVKAEMLRDASPGAEVRAVDSIRREVNEAVSEVKERQKAIIEAQQAAVQQTIEHLENHPPFSGEQEDHEQTAPSHEEAPTEEQGSSVEEPSV